MERGIMSRSLGRIVCMVGLLTCLLPAAVAISGPFRSAREAPAAWGVFAARLKSTCERVLQADDAIVRRLHASLRNLHAASSPDDSSIRVAVSLWIRPDGAIDRVSFPALGDAQAMSDLRILLSRANAGMPPPDMLQPMHLSLSLVPRG